MRTVNFFNQTTSASGLPTTGDYDGQTFLDLSGGQGERGLAVVWRDAHWDGFRTWAAGWYNANGAPWTPKPANEVLDYFTAKVDGDYVEEYFDIETLDQTVLWFVFKYESSTEYNIQVGATAADVDYYIYVEDENYNSANNPIASGRILGRAAGANEWTNGVTLPDTDRMLCWCKVVTTAGDVGEMPRASFNVQLPVGGP